jgi:hypothetical protein
MMLAKCLARSIWEYPYVIASRCCVVYNLGAGAMDQLVSGISGEKVEPQQQSGELAKTSAGNAHQGVPVSETQSSAASSPQGIQHIHNSQDLRFSRQ